LRGLQFVQALYDQPLDLLDLEVLVE
jgi:hypothetical protein